VGGCPVVAVRAGEISCRYLGARVEAWDGDRPVVGRRGELVVAAPMPSMPVALWGDDDGSRLRGAYYDPHPGVWTHGDWITLFDDGSCAISGRADATLNRGGVRLGTAEIYEVVEELPEVEDSLIVHLDAESGRDELVLFVVPAGEARLDDDLRRRIRDALRAALSPRHAPDRIEAVVAVPRTLSGKKLEVPVKRILQGRPVGEVVSTDTLRDPAALEPFVALASERAG
ncbi:MAG TPA: acetoacetate--CoA ligase, partial [Acidimicrobiales bacterium]|nr:acetoacetate--CoA ligase [Acidimicrobiales bacterium]